jgi:hypothetical protein
MDRHGVISPDSARDRFTRARCWSMAPSLAAEVHDVDVERAHNTDPERFA